MGLTALLPIFELLGTDYKDYKIITRFYDATNTHDSFTKMDFIYDHAVASIRVGDGVKSRGRVDRVGNKGVYLCSGTMVENRLF